VSGEVDKPVGWDEAKTPKVPVVSVPGISHFSRMSDRELEAYVRKEWTAHADSCRAPGGALFNLDQMLILRTAELRELRDHVARDERSYVQRRWLEVLATPAAIVVCTLIALLYLHLHHH
jgi:hypothetical protein